MVVKPQLIVAEDCLLLSSDSHFSGQTPDNLRQQKGFPMGGGVWGVGGGELVQRVVQKHEVGEGGVDLRISKGK